VGVLRLTFGYKKVADETPKRSPSALT
jgi:hypothetical protein